jgi:hypothetical protein
MLERFVEYDTSNVLIVSLKMNEIITSKIMEFFFILYHVFTAFMTKVFENIGKDILRLSF